MDYKNLDIVVGVSLCVIVVFLIVFFGFFVEPVQDDWESRFLELEAQVSEQEQLERDQNFFDQGFVDGAFWAREMIEQVFLEQSEISGAFVWTFDDNAGREIILMEITREQLDGLLEGIE